MAITHKFKGSASASYGYAVFIEDGQLVIVEEWGPKGSILFRGTYEEAAEHGWAATFLRDDQRLHDDIEKYFSKH